MGLELVVSVIELPPLPPIRTSTEKSTKENLVEDHEEQCTTPKLNEDAVIPGLVCPPTPRKRQTEAVKRKIPQELFFCVPTDLASIFVPRQPTKRIRVG
jgi:hypothetical protein